MSPRERSLPFRTDQARKRGGASRDHRALVDRLRVPTGDPGRLWAKHDTTDSDRTDTVRG
jgi:hypothetical protein